MENYMTTMAAGPAVAHPMTSYKYKDVKRTCSLSHQVWSYLFVV